KFTSVELLGTESAPLADGTKGIRFDVVAKTNDGQHVNVEIQNGYLFCSITQNEIKRLQSLERTWYNDLRSGILDTLFSK
ncbi:MAG: PD-(D/E)XK nuclease family transposase, partial [Veillonella sp.]|nr:PD-(D/E)XK nuclease family transposase [Veillonella sp.]